MDGTGGEGTADDSASGDGVAQVAGASPAAPTDSHRDPVGARGWMLVGALAMSIVISGGALTVMGSSEVPGTQDRSDEAGSLPDGRPEPDVEDVLIPRGQALEAFDAAGCTLLVDGEPLPDRNHFDSTDDAAPLDVLYPEVRPTHSGPHLSRLSPLIVAAEDQLSEASTTHNLEHGSVIVWWDPDRLNEAEADAIGTWAITRDRLGFSRAAAGVGILSSPYEDPGISSGRSVALRAWGSALDCDRWDERVADTFVAERFGTRGIAPERNLAPYPDGAVEILDPALTAAAPHAGATTTP